MLAKYKSHNNSLYIKLVELSRNIFFYKTLSLKDTFETRILLIFLHTSLILYIFREEKKIKFPQEIFDNIFLNTEYHLRELGHGDQTVNKKMKSLMQVFYDILLKINISKKIPFKTNKNILIEYLKPQGLNNDKFVSDLAKYFDNFHNYCFELECNNVLKGQINFKY